MVNKSRILLFSPNIRGIEGGVNRIQPPLGLGYLAAVLEKEGHDVYVRDTALEGYHHSESSGEKGIVIVGESDTDIAKYISEINPDIVGISVLFSNLVQGSHALARITKEVKRDLPVIVGGNYITNSVSDYLYANDPRNQESNLEKELAFMDNQNIDFAMVGESELRFAHLIDCLLTGGDYSLIPGLVHRENSSSEAGKIVINPLSGETLNLQDLPSPARHLMNMEGYFNVGLFHNADTERKRVLNVMASRGCPERCTYCTTPVTWGRKVRWRSPQEIVAEIKDAIENHGIQEVQFEDDTLTSDLSKLNELCDLMKPLNIPWCPPNGIRVDYHQGKHQELFEKMADSGCYQVTLACESGVQKTLDQANKRLDLELIPQTIRTAIDAGLYTHTFWMVGFPGETREEREETIKFAASCGADSYSVAIVNPLPGTELYRQVTKENLWWDGEVKKSGTFRNSHITVDGFKSAGEFECWVEKQNFDLNHLLLKRDPIRAKAMYGERIGFVGIKQT